MESQQGWYSKLQLIYWKRTTIQAKKKEKGYSHCSHDEHFIDYDGGEVDSSPLWHSLSSPRKYGVPWFLCTALDTLPGSDWRRQTGREDEPCTATGQRVQQGDSQCTLGWFPCWSNEEDVEDLFLKIWEQHETAVIFHNFFVLDCVYF